MLSTKLCAAIFVHAILSVFVEMNLAMFNTMAIPLQHFFNSSIHQHYGVVLNEQSFSLIYSFLYILMPTGVYASIFFVMPLMDKYGRKPVAVTYRCAFGMIAAILCILSYWFNAFELYALAQFFIGLALPLKLVTKIYLSECAPDRYRGLVSLCVNSGNVFGGLLTAVISLPSAFGNDEWWWFLPFICIIMIVVHFTMAMYFPESPKFLYKSKRDRALCAQVVRFYHGRNADEDVILDEYGREHAITVEEHYTIRAIVKDKFLRQSMLVVLFVAIVPVVSCTAIMGAFSTMLLTRFGLQGDQTMLAIIAMDVIVLPIALLSPILVERVGRRPMFLVSVLLMIVQTVTLAAATWNGDTGYSVIASVLGLVAMLSGNIAANAGIHGMAGILIAEICPPSTRVGVGQIVILVPSLLGMVIVMLYSILTAMIGVIFFIPIALVQIILMFLLFRDLPETKSVPVDINIARLDEHIRSRANTSRSRTATVRSRLNSRAGAGFRSGMVTSTTRINPALHGERQPLMVNGKDLYGTLERLKELPDHGS